MKASTILKAIGLLFVFIGAVTGAVLLASRPSFGPAGSGIAFALFFMAMFCGIGGFFAFIGFRMDGADRKILKNGDVYLGKIQDHRPDYRVTINEAPAISLVVRYFRRGEICEAVVNTGEADPARYPVGSTVSVSIYQNRAALVPGSVNDSKVSVSADGAVMKM